MRFKKTFPFFLTLSVFSFSILSADSNEDYKKPRQVLEKVSKQLEKSNSLKFLCLGSGSLARASSHDFITPWGLLFTSSKKLNLEEAKVLAHNVAGSLLKTIYEGPSFANYYASINSRYSARASRDPLVLSDNSVAFRINFWDENVDRYDPPYISEIRYVEGKIYYQCADAKTQELQEPCLVESFTQSL